MLLEDLFIVSECVGVGCVGVGLVVKIIEVNEHTHKKRTLCVIPLIPLIPLSSNLAGECVDCHSVEQCSAV